MKRTTNSIVSQCIEIGAFHAPYKLRRIEQTARDVSLRAVCVKSRATHTTPFVPRSVPPAAVLDTANVNVSTGATLVIGRELTLAGSLDMTGSTLTIPDAADGDRSRPGPAMMP